MNREIKFRAKVNGRYVYSDSYVNLAFYFDATKGYEQEQYTGLKDKNGKEIYVSDILSDRWKVEVYQNDEGTFMIKFHTNPKMNKPMTLKKYLKAREKAGTSICEGYRDCIVIGNIYENPELLK